MGTEGQFANGTNSFRLAMQNEAEDRLLSLFDRYDQALTGAINREQYTPILSALESAKIPRVPFLFHRLTEPDEDSILKQDFASRLAAAGEVAAVPLQQIIAALEQSAPQQSADQNNQVAAAAADAAADTAALPETAAQQIQLGESNTQNVEGGVAEADDMFDNYRLGTELGEGGFAKVFLGTHTETGEQVAVKVVDLTAGGSSLRDMVLGEVALMMRADHEHVVTVKQYGEGVGCIWVAMEFMGGGTLQTYIKNVVPTGNELSEDFVRGIFLQLLEAVDYLHNVLEVVHRDLKPENVLLAQPCLDCSQVPHVKIADFGLSTQYDSRIVLKLHCGTPTFFAPELIQGSGYSRAVDCWSLGLMLYLLLSARLPFAGSTPEKLKARICLGEFKFHPPPLWDARAASSRDLISRLLCVDPLVRYTAKEAANHPWAQGKDSVEDMALTVFEM